MATQSPYAAPANPNKAKFVSLRGYVGNLFLHKHITKQWNKHADAGRTRPTGEPFRHIKSTDDLPPFKLPKSGQKDAAVGKVCIIGAGFAGLYLAKLFRDRNVAVHPEPPILYDILEASDTWGGRCLTVKFPPSDPPNAIPNNYYDAGAMRIPALSSMEPVLALAAELGVPLRPYYYKAQNQPSKFYGIDEAYADEVTVEYDAVMKHFVEQIDAALEESDDFDAAILSIMDETEPYSTREYLKIEKGWDQNKINAAELTSTSTGNFDQALTESIIDYYDFQNASDIEWHRVEGGMSIFTNILANTSYSNPIFNAQVTDITYNAPDVEDPAKECITVSWKGGAEGTGGTGNYSHVFCTTSLPCLGRISTYGPVGDSSLGLGFSQLQINAIRSLQYDLATKVALRFSEPWWLTKCGIGSIGEQKYGGSGSTDLSVRTVVYPSWYDENAKATVLLASYTWSQDATRMGAATTGNKEELVDKILHDLAQIHYDLNNEITYEYLKENLYGGLGGVEYHDWSHDPNTGGAFALFGPGQFSTLYPALTMPIADDRFFICGEHASCHHAWISGSMSSVWQALGGFVYGNELYSTLNFLKNYHLNSSNKSSGKFLDAVDELEFGDRGTSHLLAELGKVETKLNREIIRKKRATKNSKQSERVSKW